MSDTLQSFRVPFCTCTDTNCPFHPTNHNQGCTPCIAKNLKEREVPSCFFATAGGEKPTPGWHFEDFAALINLSSSGS
ncbi:MAG: DUF6485 family protein [Clostridiales bacterium]|nr:DUF6485 family protein [Clostridiales bacterium]